MTKSPRIKVKCTIETSSLRSCKTTVGASSPRYKDNVFRIPTTIQGVVLSDLCVFTCFSPCFGFSSSQEARLAEAEAAKAAKEAVEQLRRDKATPATISKRSPPPESSSKEPKRHRFFGNGLKPHDGYDRSFGYKMFDVFMMFCGSSFRS